MFSLKSNSFLSCEKIKYKCFLVHCKNWISNIYNSYIYICKLPSSNNARSLLYDSSHPCSFLSSYILLCIDLLGNFKIWVHLQVTENERFCALQAPEKSGRENLAFTLWQLLIDSLNKCWPSSTLYLPTSSWAVGQPYPKVTIIFHFLRALGKLWEDNLILNEEGPGMWIEKSSGGGHSPAFIWLTPGSFPVVWPLCTS